MRQKDFNFGCGACGRVYKSVGQLIKHGARTKCRVFPATFAPVTMPTTVQATEQTAEAAKP